MSVSVGVYVCVYFDQWIFTRCALDHSLHAVYINGDGERARPRNRMCLFEGAHAPPYCARRADQSRKQVRQPGAISILSNTGFVV